MASTNEFRQYRTAQQASIAMNMLHKALVFLASVVVFAAPLRAQEITEYKIKEEQRVADFTIKDADNDLEQAGTAYTRKLNNLAWVYITECGVKLDGQMVKLKGHPERIAKATWLGFPLSKSTRQVHLDKYMKLKDRMNLTYQKMQAIEKDVGKALGIDTTWVREMLSLLKTLCDETKDPQFCDAYEKAKASMMAGQSQDVARTLSSIWDKANAAAQGLREKGIDVSAPVQKSAAEVTSAATTGTRTGSVTSGATMVDKFVSDLATRCQNGDEAACAAQQKLAELLNDPARKSVINKLLSECAKGNAKAAAVRDELISLAAACQDGDEEACDQLDELLSSLIKNFGGVVGGSGAKTQGGNSGAADKPARAPEPVSGPITIVDENGETITMKLDGEGRMTKQVYAGTRIKKETLVRVLVSPDAKQPYKQSDLVLEESESRDWNFSLEKASKDSSASASVVSFDLKEKANRTEFTVSGWSVKNSSGTVIATGAEVPFDVTFTESGAYTVEVSGTTEWGSTFTIKTSFNVTF
jgi:hypothetical protein